MHYADILQWHVWVLHSTGTRPSGCWSTSPYSPTTWINPLPGVVRPGPSWAVSTRQPLRDHWSESVSGGGTCWQCTRCVVQQQLAWRLTSSSPSSDSLQCLASAAAAVQWANIMDNIHWLTSYIWCLSRHYYLFVLNWYFIFVSVAEHCSMSRWMSKNLAGHGIITLYFFLFNSRSLSIAWLYY